MIAGTLRAPDHDRHRACGDAPAAGARPGGGRRRSGRASASPRPSCRPFNPPRRALPRAYALRRGPLSFLGRDCRPRPPLPRGDLGERGHISVKGIAHPVSTYQVVDTYAHLAAERGLIYEERPSLRLDLDLDAMSADDGVRRPRCYGKRWIGCPRSTEPPRRGHRPQKRSLL